MLLFKHYKAQFMTLISILIVGALLILYFNISGMFFINPYQYIPEQALLIKNIKEKILEIANLSKNCEEFKYNIEEFGKFLENLKKLGYYVNISLRVSPCQLPFQVTNFPTTSELEVFLSDGKTKYKETLVFSWKPS